MSSAAVVAVMSGATALGVFSPMSMMFSTERHAGVSLAVPVRPTGGLVLLVVLVIVNLALTRQLSWG